MATKWLEVFVVEGDEEPRLNTVSSCMALSDVKCDNYIRLAAVDISLEPEDGVPKAELKVFRGIELKSTHELPGIPCAIESFYIDEVEPRTPIIAVAIAESILFYRNMKPYFKFTVPELEVQDAEKEAWRKLAVVRENQQKPLIEMLKDIALPKLTRKSQKLVTLEEAEWNNFIMEHADSPLARYAHIVAMCCLQRVSSAIDNPPCHLVVAMDNGDVIILEAHSFSVLYKAKTCNYETTPSLIAVHGTYETEFCIVISTRYGGIYLLRKTTNEGQEIVKMSQPLTGLILMPVDQTIVVSTMDKRLICFSKKGKQLHAIPLTAFPVCILPVSLPHMGLTLICVAMEGGLVQFYIHKQLVDEFYVIDTVSAMLFGRMGMEEHVLILVTIKEKVIVKILRRLAKFEPNKVPLWQPSQHTRVDASILNKPKKNSIFVEQAIREKQNPKAAYSRFQADLWRLRYDAAEAVLEALKSAEGSISTNITFATLKLSSEIGGVGPEFRLFLTLTNMSTDKIAAKLMVLLHCNRDHFSLPRSIMNLPGILPGLSLKIDFELFAILDPITKLPPPTLTASNSFIRVMVVKDDDTEPLISAKVQIPQSEAPLINLM